MDTTIETEDMQEMIDMIKSLDTDPKRCELTQNT